MRIEKHSVRIMGRYRYANQGGQREITRTAYRWGWAASLHVFLFNALPEPLKGAPFGFDYWAVHHTHISWE